MTDLVILNGRVMTFAGPDAEALAITGGVITAVGSNAEIRDLAGSARVIDAQGNTVLPGFIDSHVHLFQGAAELEYLNLHGVTGFDAIAAKVRLYSASRQDDVLLFANCFEYHAFGDAPTTRQDLDAVVSDRPFFVMASDGHTGWANTKALELAGLLHGMAVDEGSEIVMAADGTASGELREAAAIGPVYAYTPLGGREAAGSVTGADPIPIPTAKERALDKDILAKGLKYCAAHGITGLHNMDGNFYQLELLSEMEKEGTLLSRIEIPMHLKHTDPLDRLEEAAQMRAQYTSDMLWSSRIKMFIDGVIDNGTAFMLQPYPETDSCSAPLFTVNHFKQACIRADAMGLQISVHAIGDAGVRSTLDGFEAARIANGIRDSRHRIEHIEVINPADIPRLAELGVVASLQPLHSPRAGFFTPYEPGAILHEFQIDQSCPWQTLRSAGAKVVFSTDWPVVPLNVMQTIQGAVCGLDPDAPQMGAGQYQSLRASLASYTCENAWVEFNEHRKGKLQTGMMADIVVMDHDLEAMPPEELGTASAAVTICGGSITYEA
ncbi:N-substituted formamide deformylase precursor [Roseovarius albus]|uniref:N-substituted formamide deformylase n=1 Tax=Roseovarius albus TaxID=1247867 RepID=A0A1X6ZKV7_9RHOB|nr:amidohydrolase [Roseovarius albus]SLN54844.1 N-substituted formamide deformylase precursor [Roseovarius albus]